MKKTYSKPQILFDSFELSQNIAMNCSIIGNVAIEKCAYKDPELGLNIFVTAINDCSDYPQPGTYSDATYGSICYEIPMGALNLFSS